MFYAVALTQFLIWDVIPVKLLFSCVNFFHVLSVLFQKRFALQRSKLTQNRSTENRCIEMLLLLASLKVSDNHNAWESKFPGQPLGDISSVHFFPTVYGADSKLTELLGICSYLLCVLGQIPQVSKRKLLLTSVLYFIKTLVSCALAAWCYWLMQHDRANIWQWQRARRTSRSTCCSCHFPCLLATSAVTRGQLPASCSVRLCHCFCHHPSLFLAG